MVSLALFIAVERLRPPQPLKVPVNIPLP
jgi:hypothetical protein